MLASKFYLIVPRPCFDNEPDAAAKAAAEAAAAEAAKKKIEFTPEQQEKMNGIIAEEKRKVVAELETLKKTVGITESRKTELEKQIEGLKASYQTKAEQDAERLEKVLNESKTNFESKSKEADGWRTRYTDTVIDRDILAAAGSDAFSPELIVKVLKPDTKLVEVIDENGKPTGRFEPRVTVQKEKDGKIITLELTPAEAVKHMKDTPAKFGSLFKSTQKSGLGGSQTPGNTSDFADLAKTNPEEFRRQYREKNFPKKG